MSNNSIPSAYTNMIDSITFRYSDRIRKSIQILIDLYSINEFYYFKILNNGYFGFIGSFLNWNEYFVANKLFRDIPYYRHPKYFENCVLPLQQIDDPKFLNILQIGQEKFDIFRSLAWINKLENGFEGFGVSTNNPSIEYNASLINELSIFQRFAKKFKVTNQFLFDQLDENLCDLKDMIGVTFFEKPALRMPNLSTRRQLLMDLNIETGERLSATESEILKYVLMGYSSSQIGQETYRSRRTVEHHVERIKDKLRCTTKSELIQKGIDLQSLKCI